MKREDLKWCIVEALNAQGGKGTIVDVAREIWQRHEAELRLSGDLFFTWQYDIRWAKKQLRDEGRLKIGQIGNKSPWILT